MLSCCTTSSEPKEEPVGKDAADERIIRSPRPGRPGPPGRLRVRLAGAAGAAGATDAADAAALRGTCGPPGAPALQGQLPLEGCVVCGPGEALHLELCAEDRALGEAKLQPGVFHGVGFCGELPMVAADGETAAYMQVSIVADDGTAYPPEPTSATGYRATIDVSPGSETELNLDLDLTDRVYARVNGIQAGPFKSHNEKAGILQRIRVDDFIYSVNGSRWAREFAHQFRRGGSLSLLVKRPLAYTVVVAKEDGTLGLDLWYEHHSSPALLVTRVINGGPVSRWNAENPDRRLERLDRIVAVNGGTGGAAALLRLIADCAGPLELATVRPQPDPSRGPVDVSGLTRMAADDLGLLPQPGAPRARTALVQVYVRGQDFGGADKSANGHRYDSVPIANGMMAAGLSCQLLHYVHQEHDQFFEVCGQFDAIILRCNPGQIRADGGDQRKFDDGMRQLRRKGVQVWPSPDVMEQMGAKDALVKVAQMHIGLEDTAAYYTEAELSSGLRKTLAFQPRVLKQNRGSSGEGIWIVKLRDGVYCSTYGQKLCHDDEVLSLTEANDNHEETHTLAEFMEFCVRGRTEASGVWASKGAGGYLEGGKAAGSQLVDQRFCPRIAEGELRYNMIGQTCVGIIHRKPKEGGVSAVAGTGSMYTFYGPQEEKYAQLTSNFLQRDLPSLMPALGLPQEPIPLWWTVDFILASPEGTPPATETWIVGEFNCSCVGISKCLAAYCQPDRPTAGFSDVSAEDRVEARRLGDMMGERARGILLGSG